MHLQISSYLLLQGRPLFIGLFHFFFQFARINARGGRAHQFLAALGQCGHQFLQRIHSIRHKALKRLRIYTLYTRLVVAPAILPQYTRSGLSAFYLKVLLLLFDYSRILRDALLRGQIRIGGRKDRFDLAFQLVALGQFGLCVV